MPHESFSKLTLSKVSGHHCLKQSSLSEEAILHSSWTECYIYKFLTESALHLLFHAEHSLLQGQMWAKRLCLLRASRDFLRGNCARFFKLICFAVSRGLANLSLNPAKLLTKEADALKKTDKAPSKPPSFPQLSDHNAVLSCWAASLCSCQACVKEPRNYLPLDCEFHGCRCLLCVGWASCWTADPSLDQ